MPPHTLSRVSAYDWMGSLALLPVGYLLAGPLGDALGPELVLGVGCGLATVVLAAGLAVRETWTLSRLEPAPRLSVTPARARRPGSRGPSGSGSTS